MDGLIADLFKLIITKYNLKTKVVTDDWTNILSQFKAGQIDMIPAAFFTKERTKFGLYSQVVHHQRLWNDF